LGRVRSPGNDPHGPRLRNAGSGLELSSSNSLPAELGFRYVELPDLLAASDAVSLHVRLSPESRHLLGSRELAQMRPGALIINTARGAVVDTDALVAALQSGHLGGAGLDVYDAEPLSADHPLSLASRLCSLRTTPTKPPKE